MKSLLNLVFLLAALTWSNVSSHKLKALSDAEIEYINSVQTSWKAGRNFDEHQLSHVKNLLGAKIKRPDHYSKNPKCHQHANVDLPTSFDSREQWPNCETMHDMLDQGECGSCWAFAASEAMSDRICVATKKNVRISPEDILACCTHCGRGCHGGWPFEAWKFFTNEGVVTGGEYDSNDGCMPYTIEHCSHHVSGKYPNCSTEMKPTPKCVPECIDGYPSTYKKDKHFGKEPCYESGVEAMKNVLYTGGPVSVTFAVYSDFLSYKSGIYKHTTGELLGYHAVKCLGWGVEDGTEYWILANSWNDDWGDKGYFKMAFAECGIENDVIYGIIE